MSREVISKQLQFQVFCRDSWHCRYCLDPVFFNPTLKLLNKLSPGHGYYHPNGKEGELLPLFQWKFASADHVVPVANGAKNSIDNLVTSCWRCNLRKSNGDPKDFDVNDIPDSISSINWDGLSTIYSKLAGASQDWVKIIDKI